MIRSARGGGGKMLSALRGPADWILRYVKKSFFTRNMYNYFMPIFFTVCNMYLCFS